MIKQARFSYYVALTFDVGVMEAANVLTSLKRIQSGAKADRKIVDRKKRAQAEKRSPSLRLETRRGQRLIRWHGGTDLYA